MERTWRERERWWGEKEVETKDKNERAGEGERIDRVELKHSRLS